MIGSIRLLTLEAIFFFLDNVIYILTSSLALNAYAKNADLRILCLAVILIRIINCFIQQ